MSQLGEHRGLSREPYFIVEAPLEEDLDCHIPARAPVSRPEDLSHAAGACAPVDLEPSSDHVPRLHRRSSDLLQ
ncbi:hypothetical protein [Sorangium sp. So ce341]|uniref:hypothetical protein n=1 Tax=Sorangium sp. So ce341 TaxID=3133302 RepID=UPI003F602A94